MMDQLRRNHRQVFAVALGLLFGLIVFLIADPAFAQSAGSAGNFYCSNGQPSGTLFNSSMSCPTSLKFTNLFSFLVCNMEQLSSNLLGHMFCGMILNLAPVVNTVLLLAVIIFGVGFSTGIIPATAREFQSFLLKIAFVWVFATQGDFIVNIGYAFFINGIRDGVGIALSGYNPSGNTATGVQVYGQLDNFLAVLIHFATDYIGAGNSSTNGDCKNAVFAVLVVLGIAFPPIFFAAIALMMKLALTFVRAVFGYIYAVVGIAFLMTLAPFFLSFYMFKQTRNFFEKWIGYIASFALQIVLLFSFLSFILSIDVRHVSESFTNVIIPTHVEETKETTSFRMPWEYCTLCDFNVVDASGNIIDPNKQADFLSKGSLKCKDNPGKPISLLTTVSPTGASGSGTPTSQQQSTLLRFGAGGLFALMILAYVIETLLGSVALLAQTLAGGIGGAYAAPQLGGGTSPQGRPTIDIPGVGLYNDFDAGLQAGFQRSSNGFSGIINGAADGVRRMVTGAGDYDNPGTRPGDLGSKGNAGMGNRFLDWLVDPNHIDPNSM